jgi:hypothetical protein
MNPVNEWLGPYLRRAPAPRHAGPAACFVLVAGVARACWVPTSVQRPSASRCSERREAQGSTTARGAAARRPAAKARPRCLQRARRRSPGRWRAGPRRRAFAPLVEAGVFEVVYGGAAEGKFLGNHAVVESIHLTGSAATFDAVVWGGKPKARCMGGGACAWALGATPAWLSPLHQCAPTAPARCPAHAKKPRPCRAPRRRRPRCAPPAHSPCAPAACCCAVWSLRHFHQSRASPRWRPASKRRAWHSRTPHAKGGRAARVRSSDGGPSRRGCLSASNPNRARRSARRRWPSAWTPSWAA